MRFELKDLRLFLAIVESGSISAGARKCHLALASASERVRKLESDIGLALLTRRPRGVMTTEAGEALMHHARLIVRQEALLKGELRDFATGARGTLHLHANTAAMTRFLPDKLPSWLAERPDLRVELKERTSLDILRAIDAGLIEAGIVSDVLEAAGLEQQPVMRDSLVLIVDRHHALARLTSLSFEEVLEQPFVGLGGASALQTHIQAQAFSAGRSLNFRVRMPTVDGVCAMVAQGVGVAILPEGALERHRQVGIVSLALTDRWAQRVLCLCFKQWRGLSPVMQSLLIHLGKQANTRPGILSDL